MDIFGVFLKWKSDGDGVFVFFFRFFRSRFVFYDRF